MLDVAMIWSQDAILLRAGVVLPVERLKQHKDTLSLETMSWRWLDVEVVRRHMLMLRCTAAYSKIVPQFILQLSDSILTASSCIAPHFPPSVGSARQRSFLCNLR